MSSLTAENLMKRYRRREVVRGVSMGLTRGEVVGLLGPNGEIGRASCWGRV